MRFQNEAGEVIETTVIQHTSGRWVYEDVERKARAFHGDPEAFHAWARRESRTAIRTEDASVKAQDGSVIPTFQIGRE